MKKKVWNQVMLKILNELPINQKVSFEDKEYDFRYIGNPKSRIGYLLIWEQDTLRAIQISRVKAPDGFPMLDIDNMEAFKVEIPNNLIIESL